MSVLGLILMAVVGNTIWNTIARDHEHEEAEAELDEDEVGTKDEDEEEHYTLVDSGIRVSVKFLSNEEQRKTRR